jgi:hypothetical protein
MIYIDPPSSPNTITVSRRVFGRQVISPKLDQCEKLLLSVYHYTDPMMVERAILFLSKRRPRPPKSQLQTKRHGYSGYP